MHKDDDPIRRIEAELDQDRAALSRALSDLRGSFSLGAMLSGGLGAAASRMGGGEAGGEAGGLAARAGRAAVGNPAVVAALGAGLAALLAKRSGTSGRDIPPAADTRLADLFTPGAKAPGKDELWMAEADHQRRRAADLLEQIDQARAAGLAPEAELLAQRSEVVAALAAEVRRVMSRDLDQLAPAERAKAFARRESLYARHLGLETGSGWVKPVVAGTALAGVGALIAMTLPRSGTEDALFSGLGTRLRSEAEGLAASDHALGGLVGKAMLAVLGKENGAGDGDPPAPPV